MKSDYRNQHMAFVKATDAVKRLGEDGSPLLVVDDLRLALRFAEFWQAEVEEAAREAGSTGRRHERVHEGAGRDL